MKKGILVYKCLLKVYVARSIGLQKALRLLYNLRLMIWSQADASRLWKVKETYTHEEIVK